MEGFSLATVEAMACGLPVVALKECRAVASIIHHEHDGLLTDPEHLHLELLRLIEDPTLRKKLGSNAIETAKQYNPDVIWEQWDQLIKNTVYGKNFHEHS